MYKEAIKKVDEINEHYNNLDKLGKIKSLGFYIEFYINKDQDFNDITINTNAYSIFFILISKRDIIVE